MCNGLETQGDELGQLKASPRLLLSKITALMLDVENQCFRFLPLLLVVLGGKINPVPVFPAWPKAEAEETEIIHSLSVSHSHLLLFLMVCVYVC